MRFAFLVSSCALCCAACSTLTPLEVHDSSVLSPAARVRVSLDDLHPGLFVAGSFRDMEGDDVQQLGGADTVVVDDVTFGPGDRLRTSVQLRVGEVVVGKQADIEGAELAFYGGLQHVLIDLEVRGVNESRSTDRDSRSLIFGVALSIPDDSWIAFDMRADMSYSLSGDELAMRSVQAGLGLRPVPFTYAFAGWYVRDLEQVIDDGSDLDLLLSGPALELGLEF